MPKLPYRKKAQVEIKKIEEYCLNPNHQRGKHKAKVFKSVLDLTRKDALVLKKYLLDAAFTQNATEILTDSFGKRYYIDSQINYKNKLAVIRSIWIVKSKEKVPRLITCYIK